LFLSNNIVPYPERFLICFDYGGGFLTQLMNCHQPLLDDAQIDPSFKQIETTQL